MDGSFLTLLIYLTIAIIGLFIYFIPTLVARSRDHENFGWISLINILGGWTGFIWIALLLWAGLGRTGSDNRARQI